MGERPRELNKQTIDMNKKLDTYDDNDGYDRVNENDDDDNKIR